jgi:predicted transcriptional regulator
MIRIELDSHVSHKEVSNLADVAHLETVILNLKNYTGVVEILNLLKDSGHMTKADIIKHTDYSRTVCDKAIAFLVGAGAVEVSVSLSQTVYGATSFGCDILKKIEEAD